MWEADWSVWRHRSVYPHAREATLELTDDRKLSGARARAPEADAAWRFLDAVWDVPVGLGLCDQSLRFIRVNDALADFDGLSVAAHYDEGDVLDRLPAEFAEGLRLSASGEAHDVEFVSAGRSVLVKLHPVLRPSDRQPIGLGIVAVDVTDERKAFRDVAESNRLVGDLLADATAKEQALSRLIESVREGLLVVDPAGRMKLVNQAGGANPGPSSRAAHRSSIPGRALVVSRREREA